MSAYYRRRPAQRGATGRPSTGHVGAMSRSPLSGGAAPGGGSRGCPGRGAAGCAGPTRRGRFGATLSEQNRPRSAVPSASPILACSSSQSARAVEQALANAGLQLQEDRAGADGRRVHRHRADAHAAPHADRRAPGLQDPAHPRVLHAQGQVHAADCERTPRRDHRGFPAPRRHPPVLRRPHQREGAAPARRAASRFCARVRA